MAKKCLIKTDADLFDYAENILFCKNDNALVDYERLDAESFKYDVFYEKGIRRADLNLIYILDEIKQEMGFSGSQCIDLLIKIEFLLCHARTHNVLSAREDLFQTIASLADFVLAECEFISTRLSGREYAMVRRKMLHLRPLNSKSEFLQQLRLFAGGLKMDVSDFVGALDFVSVGKTSKPF